MFCTRYVSLVERETLAEEYLDLRQMIELATEITKMLTEKALFCPELAASEQVQITRYLRIFKTNIWQFLSTKRYSIFVELQGAARR